MSDNDEETKKFLSVIRKGIAEYTGNDSIDVRLRGKEDKSFTAWVSLKEGRGELKFDNSFSGKALKDSNPKLELLHWYLQKIKGWCVFHKVMMV